MRRLPAVCRVTPALGRIGVGALGILILMRVEEIGGGDLKFDCRLRIERAGLVAEPNGGVLSAVRPALVSRRLP